MMTPVYAVDNGWRPMPPFVDVGQAVADIPQNLSFWNSCNAEWQHPGESEIPVLGSIPLNEVRPFPTLWRDQRTVLPTSLTLSALIAHHCTCCIFQRFKFRKFGKFLLLELFPNRSIINHDVFMEHLRQTSAVGRAYQLYWRVDSFRSMTSDPCWFSFWQNFIVVSKLLLLVSSKKQ